MRHHEQHRVRSDGGLAPPACDRRGHGKDSARQAGTPRLCPSLRKPSPPACLRPRGRQAMSTTCSVLFSAPGVRMFRTSIDRQGRGRQMSGLSIRRPATSIRTQHCEIKYKKPTRGVGQKFRCAFPTDRWHSHAEIFFSRQEFSGSLKLFQNEICSIFQGIEVAEGDRTTIYFPRVGGGYSNRGAVTSKTGSDAHLSVFLAVPERKNVAKFGRGRA
jgi:hypothetical protein